MAADQIDQQDIEVLFLLFYFILLFRASVETNVVWGRIIACLLLTVISCLWLLKFSRVL